jgi:hypothetical protein
MNVLVSKSLSKDNHTHFLRDLEQMNFKRTMFGRLTKPVHTSLKSGEVEIVGRKEERKKTCCLLLLHKQGVVKFGF